MKRPRHQARTVALQGLYQLDIQQMPPEADATVALAPLLSEAEVLGEAADYARRLVAGTWTQRERYDDMITSVSDHWDVARMAIVDRNILRLALYELLEQPDVPARVVFDEAIEIGREYGAAETPQFINGVLDAIWKQHEACRVARSEAERASGPSSSRPRPPAGERDGTV